MAATLAGGYVVVPSDLAGSGPTGPSDQEFLLLAPDETPILEAVPEPTTMIAGALLLLPFGASVLRILRKKKTE